MAEMVKKNGGHAIEYSPVRMMREMLRWDPFREMSALLPQLAAFERMAAIRPDASSYARISYARELSGDHDGAIRLMTMALDATSPNDAEAIAWHHAQLGALQLAADRVDAASREFDHAVYSFPDYPLAVEGQARVAHVRGRNAPAAALLEPLIAEVPDYEVGHVTLARAYYRLKRKEDGDRESAIAEKLRQQRQERELTTRPEGGNQRRRTASSGSRLRAEEGEAGSVIRPPAGRSGLRGAP